MDSEYLETAVRNDGIKSDDEVERHYDRLRTNGRWFWTDDMLPEDLLSEKTQRILDTKSEFLTILESSSSDELVDNLLGSDVIPSHLAIRHCMLATDIGMETLDRVADYIKFFEISQLNVRGGGVNRTYDLRWLGPANGNSTGLANSNLKQADAHLLYDLCTILCFGEYVESFDNYPTFDRCKLGTICGDEKAIADYFADLYVLFSNQTRGRINVKKGSIAENVAGDALQKIVDSNQNLSFASDSRVPDVPNEGDAQEFDYVLRVGQRDPTYLAIECAFQETTNSTLERKARQSKELYPIFKRRDYYLCHIVDGAGYFERSSALKEMVKYSDIAVGFSELDTLDEFLTEVSTTA